MTDGLDGFADALSRVVDVAEVERVSTLPAQGEVRFLSTLAPDDRKAWSEVRYRGMNHKAEDLRFYLGTVPESDWKREDLKAAVEGVVEPNVPETSARAKAGVIIADQMPSRLLAELLDDGSEGFGITVTTTGLWPADEMVRFIDAVQAGVLNGVVAR